MKIEKRKTVLGIILFYLCLFLSGTGRIHAASGLNVASPSQEQIRQMASQLQIQQDLATGYDALPSITAPYSLGSLNSATTENALNILRLVRYIAGISSNVQINSDYQKKAQAAALLNRINDQLSHTPGRPSGMEDALYDLGYDGAQKSNLASGYHNFYQTFIWGWMGDSDASNIAQLGHRRWCLNPKMTSTGFGAAGWYYAMYTTDGLYDLSSTVAWPAQNMPVEFFQDGDLAWSISLGRSLNASSIQVTLKKNDGRTWNFSSASSNGFFTVSNEAYGQRGCIIFRPAGISGYAPGDVFEVSITGSDEYGTPLSLLYRVNFFNLHFHSGGTATCQTRAICSICGQPYGDLGSHSYEKYADPEATCTNDGVRKHRCRVCRDVLPQQERIPAFGHSWKSWTTVKEASYTSEGSEERICETCGTKETRSIARKEQPETSKPPEQPNQPESSSVPDQPDQSESSQVPGQPNQTEPSQAPELPNQTEPSVPQQPQTSSSIPQGIQARGISYQKIQIAWQPVSNADGYQIYRKKSGSGWSLLKMVSSAKTSYVDTKAAAGTKYTYTIKAYQKIGGKKLIGSAGTSVTAETALPKAEIKSLKAARSHTITIKWKKSAGATQYEIYCKKGNEKKYIKIGTVSKSKTSFVHRKCKKGTVYHYKIRAVRKISSRPARYMKSAFGTVKKITAK